MLRKHKDIKNPSCLRVFVAKIKRSKPMKINFLTRKCVFVSIIFSLVLLAPSLGANQEQERIVEKVTVTNDYSG